MRLHVLISSLLTIQLRTPGWTSTAILLIPPTFSERLRTSRLRTMPTRRLSAMVMHASTTRLPSQPHQQSSRLLVHRRRLPCSRHLWDGCSLFLLPAAVSTPMTVTDCTRLIVPHPQSGLLPLTALVHLVPSFPPSHHRLRYLLASTPVNPARMRRSRKVSMVVGFAQSLVTKLS
jgi:hypothetical protein